MGKIGLDPVSMVLMTLGVVNSVTGSIYELSLGKPMKRRIAELNELINRDTDLKNQIINAYNSKNPSLMSNIISTVPGGMANKVATLERNIKEAVHNHNQRELDESISKNSETMNKIQGKLPDMMDQISNAEKAHWWNSEGKHIGKKRPNMGSDKDTFEYRDVYGKKHTGNVAALQKWTYGDNKSNGVSKFNNDKPGIITTYNK